MQIEIKKLSPDAKIPTKNKKNDAAYDLYSLEHTVLRPFERKIIRTGIAMNIPNGYYGRIAPRSGLSIKSGVDVLGGVIDSEFVGEIGVVLINLNMGEFLMDLINKGAISMIAPFGTRGVFHINQGDRIAQLIIQKCEDIEWKEVAELGETDRSGAGWGSSG